MPDDARRWLGMHIFFDGNMYAAPGDTVILRLAEPVVREAEARGWIDGHFFVRYREGGPHIRLRLRGAPAVLDEFVRPLVMKRAQAFTDLPTGVRVAAIDYEPEFDRYGGPDGMALAEQFFQASSDAAYVLLRGMTSGRGPERLGKALLAMLVVTQAFFPERTLAAVFLERYGSRYLRSIARTKAVWTPMQRAFDAGFARQAQNLIRYLDDGWLRLERQESLSEWLDEYVAPVHGVRREFERLATGGRLRQQGLVFDTLSEASCQIVPSYLHMMNNRLGVPIPHEAYLANLTRYALATREEAAV